MKKAVFLGLLPFLLVSCGLEEASSSVSSPPVSSESSSSSSSSVSSAPSSSLSSSSSSSVSSSSSSSSDGETEEPVVDYYYHEFVSGDFSELGGLTKDINGLSWEYGPLSYLSFDDGAHIGSGNNPQRDSWTFSASFPGEVSLLSWEIVLRTASGGSASLLMSAGGYQYSSSFSGTVFQGYGEDGLDVLINDISFTLQSNVDKAMYMHSLSFSVEVPSGVELDLREDERELDPIVPGEGGVPPASFVSISAEEYYSGIDFNASEDCLRSSLYSLVSGMESHSYGEATSILPYVDESVDEDGYMYGIWDGDLIPGTATGSWNKEHVWPQSRMGTDVSSSSRGKGSDLHNLRVSCAVMNNRHGNDAYDEEGVPGMWYPNVISDGSPAHRYEGDHRGDAARILFYMALRYPELSLVEGTTLTGYEMGNLDSLLRWNEEDPVDEFEMQRNGRIYEYQGNRNPFVDHPELAETFYGEGRA